MVEKKIFLVCERQWCIHIRVHALAATSIASNCQTRSLAFMCLLLDMNITFFCLTCYFSISQRFPCTYFPLDAKSYSDLIQLYTFFVHISYCLLSTTCSCTTALHILCLFPHMSCYDLCENKVIVVYCHRFFAMRSLQICFLQNVIMYFGNGVMGAVS